MTKPPLPISQYILNELAARGWSTAYAASMHAPTIYKIEEWRSWLYAVTVDEPWRTGTYKLTRREARRLEKIFGVPCDTWMNRYQEYNRWRKLEKAKSSPRLRAMVLVYMPELTHSVWQDYVSRHRTSDGLEKRLRQGVRKGEWAAWRLIHIVQEVMGNA